MPDEWTDYVRANVEFFHELGSPQGAAALGNLGRDHPVIQAEPQPVRNPGVPAPFRLQFAMAATPSRLAAIVALSSMFHVRNNHVALSATCRF